MIDVGTAVTDRQVVDLAMLAAMPVERAHGV